MKRKVFSALCVFLFVMSAIHAQWVVTDPTNLAQGIVNSVNEMVKTSETTRSAMSTFKEASKVYEQSRKYYDMFKSVNSPVSGDLEVKESILMLSETSENYMTNYGKVLIDGNYTQRELGVIAFGYNNIMRKSNTSMAGLKGIINPTGISMTDKERLDLIERVYRKMRHYRTLVNYYIRKNLRASYLQAREKGEAKQVLKLCGEDGRYW